jgi:hypothetical protein
MSIQNQIIQAIHNQRVISIVYGGHREVEPHIIYESSTGKIFLDAYQRGGYSESGHPNGWKPFNVIQITSVEVHDETFNIRDGYNPNNRKRYKRIIAKV